MTKTAFQTPPRTCGEGGNDVNSNNICPPSFSLDLALQEGEKGVAVQGCGKRGCVELLLFNLIRIRGGPSELGCAADDGNFGAYIFLWLSFLCVC